MGRSQRKIKSTVVVPQKEGNEMDETDDIITKRVIRNLGKKRTHSAGDERSERVCLPEDLMLDLEEAKKPNSSKKKEKEKEDKLNYSSREVKENLKENRDLEKAAGGQDAKQQRTMDMTPKAALGSNKDVKKRLFENNSEDDDDKIKKFRQQGSKFYSERDEIVNAKLDYMDFDILDSDDVTANDTSEAEIEDENIEQFLQTQEPDSNSEIMFKTNKDDKKEEKTLNGRHNSYKRKKHQKSPKYKRSKKI